MNLIKELKDLKEEIRAAGSASAKAKAMKPIDKLIDAECGKAVIEVPEFLQKEIVPC